MKEKKKIISKKRLAVLALALLLAIGLIAASTYAWFTSQVQASGDGPVEAGRVRLVNTTVSDSKLTAFKTKLENKGYNIIKWELFPDVNAYEAYDSNSDPLDYAFDEYYLVPSRGLMYPLGFENQSNVPIILRIALNDIKITLFETSDDDTVITEVEDTDLIFEGSNEIIGLYNNYSIYLDTDTILDEHFAPAVIDLTTGGAATYPTTHPLSESLCIDIYDASGDGILTKTSTAFDNFNVGNDGAYYLYVEPGDSLPIDELYAVIAISGENYNQLPLQNMKVEIKSGEPLILVQAVQATQDALDNIWPTIDSGINLGIPFAYKGGTVNLEP